MTVSEYVDGLLDNTHIIYASAPSYRFDYIKLVSESVSTGETVGMSLFGYGFDDYNWQNKKKELILSAVLYE